MVVGRTDCVKTTFVQNLAINNIFGKLEKAEWVSQTRLPKQPKAQIQSIFTTIKIWRNLMICSKNIKTVGKAFSMALTLLLKKMYLARTKSGSTHCYGIYYGALADISNAFPSFLTVSRKFKYNCFHIFHIIYPEETTWKSILSQMKMFNIFPGFIQEPSITKIFLSNWIRESVGYLPQNALWLNWFFWKSSQ